LYLETKRGKIEMEIELAVSKSGRCQISDFIDGLQRDEKAQVYASFTHIETYGLTGLDTRQIQGKIWEFKTYRYNRFFYFVKTKEKMIILYAMKKQKNKLEVKAKEQLISIYKKLK
jgi:phage-related protein